MDYSIQIPWKWVIIVGATGLGVVLMRRHFIAGGVCTSKRLLNGKTVIITGANTGIGKATALQLAKRHARVILACRDVDKANKAVEDIRSQTSNGSLVVKQLDLASLQSIRDFANQICKEEICVAVLVNNAGVYQCPFALTSDGLETQMGVNHFGHFLLTNLLMDKLKASAPSRVVVVTSGLHKYGHIEFDNLNSEKGYDKVAAYNNSKLANNLFARELARRTKGSGVGVYCLRPGMVRTDLGRHVEFSAFFRILGYPLAWLLVKSPEEGCQTVVHCAIAEELEGVTGDFYADCKKEAWSEASTDDKTAKQLWDVSEHLTGLVKI